MNFVVTCLHSLDMRDFHSMLRTTPFLDGLRRRSVFIPMGRAQGHHQGDSLIAELTGLWTARCSDSELTPEGYIPPRHSRLPPTVIERLQQHEYDLFTAIDYAAEFGLGSAAADSGMRTTWLKDEPHRRLQFSLPKRMDLPRLLEAMRRSHRFYAHIVIRETHRPWGNARQLQALANRQKGGWLGNLKKRFAIRDLGWPADAAWARSAALENPDEFAALRRRGLAAADRVVEEIFEATKDIDDVVYVVYSNHGEMFDHFRGHLAYSSTEIDGHTMIEGTSHGNYPYEVAYANMQMWVIPGTGPLTMAGIARLIDFAPTILDLAGLDSGGFDGETMLPAFASGQFAARDRYAEGPLGGGCLSMVRSDGLKLVSIGVPEGDVDSTYALGGFSAHRRAVFDLESDSWELVNLADTPRGKDLLRWAVSRHQELKQPHPKAGVE